MFCTSQVTKRMTKMLCGKCQYFASIEIWIDMDAFLRLFMSKYKTKFKINLDFLGVIYNIYFRHRVGLVNSINT